MADMLRPSGDFRDDDRSGPYGGGASQRNVSGSTGPTGLREANSRSLGLASYYDATRAFAFDPPISLRFEIARRLAREEIRLGFRPTVLFSNIEEHPGSAILGNPYPRTVVLASLGLDESDWLRESARRLGSPTPTISHGVEASWVRLPDLDALPVMHHRPGDAGPYVTSGVASTRSPETGRVNLGVYRIQVVDPQRGLIFFDPKTDAFRNLQESLHRGRALPIAIFIGAHPIHMLVGASRLPPEEDDFHVAARLLQEELRLALDPPVPIDSSYVILGEVTSELGVEGPFAEFKGYYVEARQSHVLQVGAVWGSPGAVYPAIVTGAESGLTLMSLQNEYLMYTHLVEEGFAVDNVQYPTRARGEFVTLIASPEPSEHLLRAAMAFDVRSKLFMVGRHLERPWDAIASHGFSAHVEPYVRKGNVEGDRIGLILDRPPSGREVEY
jgi:2,5-furandicarboxylate decarboxylase 1